MHIPKTLSPEPETLLNDYPNINEPIVCQLDHLLDAVPASRLRRSLHQVLFGYLIRSTDIGRYDFQQVMEDVYVLSEFLEKVGELKTENNSKPSSLTRR